MTGAVLNRMRRSVYLLGILAVAVGIVEARAATAAPVRLVALSGAAGHQSTEPVDPTRPASGAGRPAAPRARSSATRSVLGAPVDIGYGIVQVRVVLHGSRITDVVAVQLPTGGRSADIASYAAPTLRSEVLARQSAAVDTVSGASYTSDGYARSVQAALDAVGLR